MNFDLSRVHGIVVPVITPLNKNESIDESSLHKIIKYLLDAGVHGIFVNSTTGEGVSLADSDRKKALQIIVNAVNGTVPVYASVSDTSTKRALRNLKEVEEIGADIAVAHPPFYYPPNSQEELYNYYEQIARVAAIPVMLYNIPFTTQAPIGLETIQRLLDIDKIIGIKDSSVDFVFLGNLIKLKNTRPDFKIFVGKSHLWTAGILSGADGGLDGISNLIPKHCVRLYDDIKAGSKNVYSLQKEINEIWRVYECRSFLGGIKAAMNLLGLCKPITAKPILAASEEEIKRIRRILLDRGILNQESII